MEKWMIQSIWIAVFGFLKEFRPEDPYITQYLTNPPMNFTNNEVSVLYIKHIEVFFNYILNLGNSRNISSVYLYLPWPHNYYVFGY